MRLKMSDKSLFAVLLRSPWWLSFAIALMLGLAVRLFSPSRYVVPALSICIPFVVIGCMAAWKQLRLPGAGKIEATVEAVSAMSWREFAAVLESAFQREGFAVTRLAGEADFRLEKAGRVTLVSGKRWKAANHGVEPLRELVKQREKQEAHEAVYIAVGIVSENARRFARENNLRIIGGMELTSLLRLPKVAKSES